MLTLSIFLIVPILAYNIQLQVHFSNNREPITLSAKRSDTIFKVKQEISRRTLLQTDVLTIKFENENLNPNMKLHETKLDNGPDEKVREIFAHIGNFPDGLHEKILALVHTLDSEKVTRCFESCNFIISHLPSMHWMNSEPIFPRGDFLGTKTYNALTHFMKTPNLRLAHLRFHSTKHFPNDPDQALNFQNTGGAPHALLIEKLATGDFQIWQSMLRKYTMLRHAHDHPPLSPIEFSKWIQNVQTLLVKSRKYFGVFNPELKKKVITPFAEACQTRNFSGFAFLPTLQSNKSYVMNDLNALNQEHQQELDALTEEEKKNPTYRKMYHQKEREIILKNLKDDPMYGELSQEVECLKLWDDIEILRDMLFYVEGGVFTQVEIEVA